MKKVREVFSWIEIGIIAIVGLLIFGFVFYAVFSGMHKDIEQSRIEERTCGRYSDYREDKCPYFKCYIERLNSTNEYKHTRYQTCLLQEQGMKE